MVITLINILALIQKIIKKFYFFLNSTDSFIPKKLQKNIIIFTKKKQNKFLY